MSDIQVRLLDLSGRTSVMYELLAEDEGLLRLVRAGKSDAELLVYVNENY